MLCLGEPSLRLKQVGGFYQSLLLPQEPPLAGRLRTVPRTVSVLLMMECRGSSARSSAACELKSRPAWKLDARLGLGLLDWAGVRQGHRKGFPGKTNMQKEQTFSKTSETRLVGPANANVEIFKAGHCSKSPRSPRGNRSDRMLRSRWVSQTRSGALGVAGPDTRRALHHTVW